MLDSAAPVRCRLVAGDTLREFRRKELPGSVVDSASTRVVCLGFDAECSRFFGSAARLVVLLEPDCERQEEEAIVHDEGLLILTRDDRFLRQVLGPLWGFSLTPLTRPRGW
ncbi:MAG TPA: hypothetical protein VNK43_05145 [Gemmatimonadales bacterium]|nr:hypothetical protein [Gemmatimonadales bacterium]